MRAVASAGGGEGEAHQPSIRVTRTSIRSARSSRPRGSRWRGACSGSPGARGRARTGRGSPPSRPRHGDARRQREVVVDLDGGAVDGDVETLVRSVGAGRRRREAARSPCRARSPRPRTSSGRRSRRRRCRRRCRRPAQAAMASDPSQATSSQPHQAEVGPSPRTLSYHRRPCLSTRFRRTHPRRRRPPRRLRLRLRGQHRPLDVGGRRSATASSPTGTRAARTGA